MLVTGVSGYIGQWTAYYLLAAGYRVRGTVRSAARGAGLADAIAPPGAAHRLELAEAELLSAAGWGAAVAGCAYVLHVASPFVLAEPSDPDVLVKPAVEGTLNVLRACAAAQPPPRRVVVTSSVAAVAYGRELPAGHVFTEADWTDPAGKGVGAYVRSKVLAERAAWDFVQASPAFELATVNPVMVMGPALGRESASGSLEVIGKFFTSSVPGFPKLPMNFVVRGAAAAAGPLPPSPPLPLLSHPLTHATHTPLAQDVRDVALLHVAAMRSPAAAGKRFLASGSQSTMNQLGPPLAAAFAPLGFRVVSATLPTWLLSVTSLFMADAALALRNMKAPTVVSSAAAEALIGEGFAFNADAGAMAVALARSCIAAGLIKDASKGCALSSGRSEAEVRAAATPATHAALQRFRA